MTGLVQIGQVAARTGLSLRTIRYYEEIGLAGPSSRSPGGFRLYSESDVVRLERVQRLAPLDFTLEELRDLLRLLDRLIEVQPGPERDAATASLIRHRQACARQIAVLQQDVDDARAVADLLARATAGLAAGVRGDGTA